MNEYEIATLALRESALWVAAGQLAATLLVGAAQIAVVWYGIRAMQQAGAQRAREQDQRHTEAMRRLDQQAQDAASQRRALETLIERTGASANATTRTIP